MLFRQNSGPAGLVRPGRWCSRTAFGVGKQSAVLAYQRRSQVAIAKEELIALLNKDLEWEFAALVQYVQHAAALTGANR